MSKATRACVVTIAGTDPSGGAGIQADIKAISATGSYAASVITALVAQNTQGVQAIEPVSPAFIQQQIDSLWSDLAIDAIKIGMLGSEQTIDVIAKLLKSTTVRHVVLDPVMVAKNGSALLHSEVIAYFKQHVLSHCTLMTPNLHEASVLLDAPIDSTQDMTDAARVLSTRYQVNVLLKGGHLAGTQASDVLFEYATEQLHWFHAERITTKNTHGTGCTLSSAIASYLAQGHALQVAITKAKDYLTAAIQAAASQHIGKGFGPVDHFYFLD